MNKPAEVSKGSALDHLIRKLARFAPLTWDEINGLRSLPVMPREYPRGEVIVPQGSIQSESAVVISGITCRAKHLSDGTRQIVSLQVPGDFVDLHSFVLKPMDHAVEAASKVLIGRITHTAIEAMLEHYPRLCGSLMWDMAVDAAMSREWLAITGRRSAYQRLAHLFCELYFRLEWVGRVQDQGYEFALTQEMLADASGLTPVHVNRSLQSLRADGLIVMEKQRLTIPDIGALVAAADFDAAYLHLLK
jgi:CRP-like cAMP-binding protein